MITISLSLEILLHFTALCIVRCALSILAYMGDPESTAYKIVLKYKSI